MSAGACRSVTGNDRAFEASRRGIELLIEKQLPFIVKGGPPPSERRRPGRVRVLGLAGCPGCGGEKPALALAFELRTRAGLRGAERRYTQTCAPRTGDDRPDGRRARSRLGRPHLVRGRETFPSWGRTIHLFQDRLGDHRRLWPASILHLPAPPRTRSMILAGVFARGRREGVPAPGRAAQGQEPRLPGEMRPLFPQGRVPPVPGLFLVGAWDAGHARRISLPDNASEGRAGRAHRDGGKRPGCPAAGSRSPAGPPKRTGGASACRENLKESDNG